MPLPYWLHCNCCGHEFSSKLKFYLLNCQHVVCIVCLRKTGDGNKCPIDNKAVERCELEKLPSKMKSYFEPAEGLLKKANDAALFQQKQQLNFVKFDRSFDEKLKRAAHQVATLGVKLAGKNAEKTKVRDRRIKMQIKLKEIRKKSPALMLHRSSGVIKSPSSVASSVSPASSFTSTPRLVRPVYGFTPSSGASTVRAVTNSNFFDQHGPFMKKIHEYKEIYSQKGSQKSHSSSRKPFFA